jgi:hypothetical protein
LFENFVEHVDIVSSRLSFSIGELERTEVPVTDNNQRFLLGIAKVVGREERREQGKKVEE